MSPACSSVRMEMSSRFRVDIMIGVMLMVVKYSFYFLHVVKQFFAGGVSHGFKQIFNLDVRCLVKCFKYFLSFRSERQKISTAIGFRFYSSHQPTSLKLSQH